MAQLGLLFLDLRLVVPDAIASGVMAFVGINGMKYFLFMMKKNDLKQLRYIWEPGVISGSFFVVLVFGLLINDLFGTIEYSPYYLSTHVFLFFGSGLFALSIYRFTRTIKEYERNKKRANTLSTKKLEAVASKMKPSN